MARQIRVILTDDIDGSEGAQTLEFALAGKNYSIDLNETNRKKLETALAPFIEKADKVSRGRTQRRSSSSSARSGNTSAVRSWARGEGYEVSDRGRVPAHIVEAYEAAH